MGNICSMLTCGKSKCDCCDLVDDETGIFKPISKRGCTDVLCLAIFLVYFFAMIAIGAVSASGGNLDYLFYPQDYLGQFCGKSGTSVASWAITAGSEMLSITSSHSSADSSSSTGPYSASLCTSLAQPMTGAGGAL